MSSSTNKILETYERDGFVFPIDIVGEAEAGELRVDLEAGERELEGGFFQ